MPKEDELYAPVRNALERFLRPFAGDRGLVHLEITASTGPSNELKQRLPSHALFLWNVEKFKPDIMGYVASKLIPMFYRKDIIDKLRSGVPVPQSFPRAYSLVVVEIKNEAISFHDIYQAKGYAELYNSNVALLISDKAVPEEVKRILHANPKVLESATNGTRIRLAEFHASTDELHWFPSAPNIWPEGHSQKSAA